MFIINVKYAYSDLNSIQNLDRNSKKNRIEIILIEKVWLLAMGIYHNLQSLVLVIPRKRPLILTVPRIIKDQQFKAACTHTHTHTHAHTRTGHRRDPDPRGRSDLNSPRPDTGGSRPCSEPSSSSIYSLHN